MSKVEHLNVRVEKLLSKAVQEVLDVVRETVSEYRERTARTWRENQSLKRRLQELQENIDSSNRVLLQQLKEEPQQKETLQDDVQLVSSDEEVAVICPPYGLNDCDLSITSVATHRLSPEAASGQRDSLQDLENPKTNAVIEAVNPTAALPVGEDDQNLKVEPPLEDTLKIVNCFHIHASMASLNRLNPPPSEASSGVFEEPGVGHSPGQTGARRRTAGGGSGWAAFQTDARKQYCCSLCGRTFRHAGDYKKHSRVHTGEKPYGCPVCGKRFSQSSYLTVHLRYHTGEKPFGCRHCGKTFSNSSNMKKHELTHL